MVKPRALGALEEPLENSPQNELGLFVFIEPREGFGFPNKACAAIFMTMGRNYLILLRAGWQAGDSGVDGGGRMVAT